MSASAPGAKLTLSRPQAVALMVLVTLLWATAGAVTRQLQFARSFEVTFWRALACAVSMGVVLGWQQGAALWRRILRSPAVFWGSVGCWSVMFSTFMVALTLTSVGNVLVTMAVGPLLTALFSWIGLGQRVPLRTWLAIVLAGAGIGAMFVAQMEAGGALGTLVALCVPVTAAINWTLTQYAHQHGQEVDMVPAVLVGAAVCAVITLFLAWPLRANFHDAALLCGLGAFQLALPCALCIQCTRVLKAPEVSLLQLLEVVFGIALAWLVANEAPTSSVLTGGALVIVALVGNELLGIWNSPVKN